MQLADVRTIADTSRYIASLLRECDEGKRSQEHTAACIVALMALDESDKWASSDDDYMLIVDNLASDAELSREDATAVWPELKAAANRLTARWG